MEVFQQHTDPQTCSSQAIPWVVGHRGALYQELENTLPGFQYCLDIGVDAVELDVFRIATTTTTSNNTTEQDNLIVFHGGEAFPGDFTDYCFDPTIHRDRHSIMDFTFQDLQQTWKFNSHYAEFACPVEKIRSATIPTLRQVLELYQNTSIVIKIELKGPNVVEPVLNLVQELNMEHQCHFSSFYHDRIHLIRKLHPETISPTNQDDENNVNQNNMTRANNAPNLQVYKTGALFADVVPDDFVAQALAVGASEVHLKYDTCTVDRIQQIHQAGLKSMAWFRGPVGMKEDCETKYSNLEVGNEDERMYNTLLQTGVQQICCNRPDVLINMLKKMGIRH